MVTTGAVEMTDAVLVVAEPIVVPSGRKSSFKDCKVNNRKVSSIFSIISVLLTSETDASAGERHNWVYSHRSRCVTGHKTGCTRYLKQGIEGRGLALF